MSETLILPLLLALPLAPAEPGPDVKKDLEGMQGTWSVVSASGPDKPPEDFIKKARFVFDKDTIKVTGGPGKEEPVKFKLSVDKGNGAIDIQPPSGGKPVLGLYKFEKGQLTLTFLKPGTGRPAKFGDDKAMTVVLKKVPK